jgi:hypothetical protein
MSSAFPPSLPSPIDPKPHRGALILTLGILGILVCGLCGIFAWVFGNADLREISAGRMDPKGRQLTEAGKICGIVGTCFAVLQVGALCLWLTIVFGFFGAVGAAGAAGAASRSQRSVPALLP